jgi:hypothetical protein
MGFEKLKWANISREKESNLVRKLAKQRNEFQFTVVQKLNQGTNPQTGGYRLRGPFFVLFWASKKGQEKKRTSCLLLF